MSAVVHLFEIAEGVKWISGPYYDLKPSEITDELWKKSSEIVQQIYSEADKKFAENFDENEKNNWIDKEFKARYPLYEGDYSDNKEHDTFEIYRCTKKNNGRSRKLRKYMNKAKELFSEYIQDGRGKYYNNKFIILNEVFYRQGWFFNKRLFRCKESIFYAFDKASAIRLANMLIDTRKEYGKEVKNDVINKLNEYTDTDKIIFKIAW